MKTVSEYKKDLKLLHENCLAHDDITMRCNNDCKPYHDLNELLDSIDGLVEKAVAYDMLVANIYEMLKRLKEKKGLTD